VPFLARLLGALALCLVVACGGGGNDDAALPNSDDIKVTPAGGSPAATQPAEGPPSANVTDEPVRFETADGVTIAGHLYSTAGPKRKVVVLAHEFPTDQTAWKPYAQELAGRGYHALTLDFRGYGETGGAKDAAKVDRDLEAAVRFIRSRDYPQVYVIGASMGGTAALKVASRVQVAGVATLSAPTDFQGLDARPDIEKIAAPKLFIAAQGDNGAPAAVAAFMQSAGGTKQEKLFPGSDHGTQVFKGASGAELRDLLLTFLGAP
jgi:alpha-beta hydrolase superfamily lysophospholipase